MHNTVYSAILHFLCQCHGNNIKVSNNYNINTKALVLLVMTYYNYNIIWRFS